MHPSNVFNHRDLYAAAGEGGLGTANRSYGFGAENRELFHLVSVVLVTENRIFTMDVAVVQDA